MKSVNKYKLMAVLSAAFFGAVQSNAQDVVATPAANDTGFSFSPNTALTFTAVLLLFVIIVLYSTLKAAMEKYFSEMPNGYEKKNNSGNAGKITALIMLLSFSSSALFAQNAAATVKNDMVTSQNVFYIFWGIIIVIEMLAILYMRKQIHFYLGLNKQEVESKSELFGINWSNIWQSMNKFKPIEQEANMDTGHNYDGIRELDNITPPWFTFSFVASIIFAIIYLWRFHVAESAPLQLEEYKIEMEKANIEKEEFLKKSGNAVDETNVKLLSSSADIAEGARLYKMQCVACHGDKGQGGVGPNLTDEYWLHGGDVKNIFKTIKYGVAGKGMQSWKSDYSPVQIQKMASYIRSLKGTKPAGAKDKQGELYVEAPESAPASTNDSAATSVIVDSTKK